METRTSTSGVRENRPLMSDDLPTLLLPMKHTWERAHTHRRRHTQNRFLSDTVLLPGFRCVKFLPPLHHSLGMFRHSKKVNDKSHRIRLRLVHLPWRWGLMDGGWCCQKAANAFKLRWTQRQSGDHPSMPTEGRGGQSTQSFISIPPIDTSALLDYKLGDLFIRYKAAERNWFTSKYPAWGRPTSLLNRLNTLWTERLSILHFLKILLWYKSFQFPK